MSDCFWTDAVGCYDSECGLPPPSTLLHTLGVTTHYNHPTDPDSHAFSNYVFSDVEMTIPAGVTTAKCTKLYAYYASDFVSNGGFSSNCPVAHWSSCLQGLAFGGDTSSCVGGESIDAPPIGALYDSEAESYVFDPTDVSAFAGFRTWATTRFGLSGSSSPRNYYVVFIATIQTNVGIVNFPIALDGCI